MYDEEDLIPISLIQHYVFCERRAAFVGLEQIWDENESTIQGEIMHEKAHSEVHENRGEILIRNALRIRSLEIGLIGVADVVEFHKTSADGIVMSGVDGKWKPFPIEYKKGAMHEELPYQIQLCAQALCLEEMLGTIIDNGAIYWGESRRRQAIEFDLELRRKTIETVDALRVFLNKRITPEPKYTKRCKGCSLLDVCMPERITKRDFKRYMAKFFSDEENGG